jgi:hypothetical protein
MPKIIKPARPLVIAGHDETHSGRFGQPLYGISRYGCGPLCSRLTEDTLDDLGPGGLGTDVLDKFSDSGIAALHSAREQHPGSSIGVDHGSDCLTSHSAWLLATPHRQGDVELVSTRHVAATQIGDRPCEPQHLVDPARTQPATVDGLIDGL